MPELPEVEFVRRLLEPVIVGARVEALVVRRAGLRIPFPERFEDRLVGQRVTAVTRRAKYLLIELGSGETLVVHLGMSGWFRVAHTDYTRRTAAIEPGGEDPRHDHVELQISNHAVVTFNDPRRFGLMDLVPRGSVDRYRALVGLGPEPLSGAFDGVVLAHACHRRKVPIKVALLDQKDVAGVGNIYASEACFEARLSPRRRAATLATATGAARPSAHALAVSIKKVLARAIDRPQARFKVYERAGEPCPRRGCAGTIRRIVQAGRSTYYCPTCQR